MQVRAAVTVMSAVNVMLAQMLHMSIFHVSTSAYLSMEASGCADGYLLLSGFAAHHRRCCSLGAPSPSAKMGTCPASSTCGSLGLGGAGSCSWNTGSSTERRYSGVRRLRSC
jgi:hypothetical protein